MGRNKLLTSCSLLIWSLRAGHSSAKATLRKITWKRMDVLKLHFHVTIFMCVPWDHKTPGHKAQVHSLDKSLLTEKTVCDSSRKDEILFCLATVVLVWQNQKLSLPEDFLLQLGENFALHCLPHLCWSMPWGHQCCFSADDRQKASFHLVRIWGRQQNTWHVSIFLLMFQCRNIYLFESHVGMNVSRQAISFCNSEAALAALLRRDSLHSEQRCMREKQREQRAGDTSLLCFRLGNPSCGNSPLLLYDCRACITYSVLWLLA